MTYGAKNYKQMAITTASPTQILIMLYEGAIQNVKKAIIAIEQKNIPEKGKYIGKAHDIINELTASLNHEVGGDVSKDLERLYNFMRREAKEGRQAFIIYPLVEESDKLDVKAATAEYERWKERLHPFTCELLHGRIDVDINRRVAVVGVLLFAELDQTNNLCFGFDGQQNKTFVG